MRRITLRFTLVIFACTMSPTLAGAQPLVEPPAEADQPRSADAPHPPSGYLGLFADNTDRGVVVNEVHADGPADRGGVQPGDRITAVGEEPIDSLDDLAEALSGVRSGERVELTVSREGERRVISVTLSVHPALDPSGEANPADEEMLPPAAFEAPAAPRREPASLGVTLREVNDQTRARFGIAVREGAFIGQVHPGSPADRAGLPAGGVIVRIDDRRIAQPSDVTRIVGESAPGDELQFDYYVGRDLRRRTVRLGALPPLDDAPPVAAPPPADGDRPVLRKLDRVLDDLTDPDSRLVEPSEAELEMYRQVEDMQQQIDALKARVRLLERRLDARE